MALPHRLCPLALTVALAACAPPAAPSTPPVEEGFVQREGFDERATARRLDQAFSSRAQRVRSVPDGSLWTLYTAYPTVEASLSGTPLLQRLVHVSAEGTLLRELATEGVSDFAVHPDGELTLLLGGNRLHRLRPDGTLRAERSLELAVPPDDRWTYLIFPDGSHARVQDDPSLERQRVRRLEAAGEEVLVLVGASGARVVRLDAGLQTRWTSRALYPGVSLRADALERQALGYPFDGEQLTVDEAGRAWVAALFPPAARAVYQDALGQLPEGPEGNTVLVVGLEADGTARFARALPKQGTALGLAGLAVRGEAFAVASSLHRPLDPPLPNDSVELDLALSGGRLGRPAAEAWSRVLSLDRDDDPVAFFPCASDALCLAGTTGTVSVDTKSMVQEGRGFVLVLDAEGERRELALLGGPRHTALASAAAGPGGTVVFAVQANAPITHTGDQDPALRFNELWAGVLSLR